MTQRRFVLEPLAEIAPNTGHPVAKKTIRQLLDGITSWAKSVETLKNFHVEQMIVTSGITVMIHLRAARRIIRAG